MAAAPLGNMNAMAAAPNPTSKGISMSNNLKLGQTVKDQVTGFQGILTGLAVHLTGEHRGLVASSAIRDGFMPAARWFDVRRLQIVKAECLVLKPNSSPKPVSPKGGKTKKAA